MPFRLPFKLELFNDGHIQKISNTDIYITNHVIVVNTATLLKKTSNSISNIFDRPVRVHVPKRFKPGTEANSLFNHELIDNVILRNLIFLESSRFRLVTRKTCQESYHPGQFSVQIFGLLEEIGVKSSQ